MASRLKKLLHTKKDEQDSPDYIEQDTTHARRRLSKSGRHSLDDPNTFGGAQSPAGNTMSGIAEPQSRHYAPGAAAPSSEQSYQKLRTRQQDEMLSSELSKMNLEGTHLTSELYTFSTDR